MRGFIMRDRFTGLSGSLASDARIKSKTKPSRPNRSVTQANYLEPPPARVDNRAGVVSI